MAIYYARANGNVNATNVWSTTPTGATSDLFPSFNNADTLMANGFTITLNVNTTVLEVRNDTNGGATSGGLFNLTSNVILTASIYGSTTNNTVCVELPSGSGSATINGNIFGGSGINAIGARNSNSNGTLTVIGNITGGSAAANGAQGIVNSQSGTINITGTVTGGSNSSNLGAVNSSTGILTINGNVIGGVSTNATGAYNNSSGTLIITGNITGGSASGAYGVTSVAAGTVIITGNVIGGSNSAGVGVYNSGNGSITIVGVSISSSVAIGSQNFSTGTLTVTRAKGNGFGNGSVGLNSVVGVAGNQAGLTRVYEIEYGDLGQSPTSGPVFLFPASSNVALFYRSGTTKKTLVDASSSSGLLPNQSDVRAGTTYNAGTNTGTMSVPTAASVALGVNVDNTTGTAILTSGNIGDIWNYPVSGISVSNSIGERLKNCSTVATMGQQLAAALNNVQ